MGTPDFAVPSLDILVQNGLNVVAVITSTDKYGGRGGKKTYRISHKEIRCIQRNPCFTTQKSQESRISRRTSKL